MRPHPRADLLVVGVAVTIVVLIVVTMPYVPCSAVTCGPEPLTSVGISLLAAVPVMSYLHRWSAVVAAVVCAVLWPIADRIEDVGMGWHVALPLVLLAVTVAVARLRYPAVVAGAGHSTGDLGDVRRERPPELERLPSITRPVLVGTFLVGAALAGITATLWHQAAVTAQEASSSVIGAVVREHHETRIGVDLDNGDSYYLEVFEPADYPVGSRVEVLVDDAGLRQLSSEPYDITVLLLPLVTVAGAGVALLVRAGSRRRVLRRFLAEPQPVRAVQAIDSGVEIVVMLTEPATAARQFTVRVEPVPRAAEAGPATLYGDPRPGEWCVVVIGRQVRVPRRPIGKVSKIPYELALLMRAS
ncbi:hypothetical protein FB565_007335 [Actinoplanes lutulentus]|uniref:hypothetical protein n=1 Tax=Actinoplanes lutulentus TaxID=1287878 RepID=UPI000DB9AADA|nr:hypothetical protein [Actinoplanes lutulentus]MBB2947564.1 hypothetical protein [Actinoplanes lutulentus]